MTAAAFGAISGTVSGPDGPVAGVHVRARSESGSMSVVTGADGTYTLTHLYPGTYTVDFDGLRVLLAPEYYDNVMTKADAQPVTVTSGVTTSGIDAVLAETGTTSGTVTGPEGPAEGVEVWALDPIAGHISSAMTGASGEYTLTGLPAGQYRVWFNAKRTGLVSEYFDDQLLGANAEHVTVATGADTIGIDAALAAGGAISGTVIGPDGPVQGIEVRATRGTGEARGSSTGPDGTYEIVGIPEGTYQVWYDGQHVGLVSEYYDDALLPSEADAVTVTAEVTTTDVDAALVDGGSIAGAVRVPSGPLPDAVVTVFRPGWEWVGSAVTAHDGSYRVDGLPTGSFVIQFEAPHDPELRREFYANKFAERTATAVPLGPQEDREGIDATLRPKSAPLFTDVPRYAPFSGEIEALALDGIAGGYADERFHPSAAIERQAIAAFLYRLADEPAFVPPAAPTFWDVPTTAPFFTEVEWMASTGITTGWPDGSFRPTAPVERQAVAAFLYRTAQRPSFVDLGPTTFVDVPLGSQFFTEIAWLQETGLTSGWPDGTFRPTATVERQAMAAFLVRFITWQTKISQ